jgi:hypothetical protein
MITHREEELASEYESYKSIVLNEMRNLSYDLEIMTKERNTFRDTLAEFQSLIDKNVFIY